MLDENAQCIIVITLLLCANNAAMMVAPLLFIWFSSLSVPYPTLSPYRPITYHQTLNHDLVQA